MNAGHPNLIQASAPLTPAEETQKEQALLDQIKAGLRQVTPTLLLVTIATGFAFAIGTGLGGAFMREHILPERPPRRGRSSQR